MASSFHKWESDPLFSAAEVVQDSADRMETIYRILIHEQSLVHGDHPDPRLLTSINGHRRDLSTILETTKWQLEDFEKAVSLSAIMNKDQMSEDVIVRHTQFIGAIREHINQVEKSLEDSSVGNSIRNYAWVSLNKQDRDGLELFLSGGNAPKRASHHDAGVSSSLRRFLDPTLASSSQDDGIIEDSRENESIHTNGFAHADQYYGSGKHNNLRKVGSHFSARLGLDTVDPLQETSHGVHNEDPNSDPEANETKPRNFFNYKKLRGKSSRVNIFRYLHNLWCAYGSRITRSYTKRLKDGEEERDYPSDIDVSYAVQGQQMRIGMQGCLKLSALRAICQRFHVQADKHFVKMILLAISSLAVLGILVHRFT